MDSDRSTGSNLKDEKTLFDYTKWHLRFAVLCNLIYIIMLDELIKIDQQILLFFNQHHSLYWDQVMWVYTGKFIWIPLILSFAWVYFRKNWKDALWAVLMMVLVVTVCDQFASTICKPFFARFRPAQDPDFSQYVTIVNGYRGGRFGFISSHAANAAGLVTFTALLFKDKLYTFTAVIWAILTCYSRMYLGVHYPGDILAGGVWGILVGWSGYHLYIVGRRVALKRGWFHGENTPYIENKDVRAIIAVIYITFVVILAISPWINFRIK